MFYVINLRELDCSYDSVDYGFDVGFRFCNRESIEQFSPYLLLASAWSQPSGKSIINLSMGSPI